MVRSHICALLCGRRLRRARDGAMGYGEAAVHHAVVVIFLEYFAWGLLTVPVINVRFPHFGNDAQLFTLGTVLPHVYGK